MWPAGAKTQHASTEEMLPPPAKWKDPIGVCPLFPEVFRDTWKERDCHMQGDLSLFWIILPTEDVEVTPSEFLTLKMCLYLF